METFGIISAYIQTASPEINRIRLEELKTDLRALGYQTLKEVRGSWKGAPEISLLVGNPNPRHLVDLGQRYGQEAVVLNDQLVRLIAPSVQPRFLTLSQRLASISTVADVWLATSRDPK